MNDIHPEEINEKIKIELLESLSLFGDSEYTGYEPLRPVSKIIFAAQGEITSPPDLEFMGYGGGSEGESFSDCGGVNLEAFFPLDSKGEYFANDDDASIEECFQEACATLLVGLKSISNSDEFQKLPKEGPVVFALKLIDQISRVICRIHPNGEVELPPKKE